MSSDLEEALEKAKKEKAEEPLRNIKTYQTDVAEAIKRDNVSVIKMAVAEKRRQERQGVASEEVSTESKKRIVLIILSAILVTSGLAIVGYFIFRPHNNTVLPVAVARTIIVTDKTVELKLDNVTLDGLIHGLVANKSILESGSIENVIITVKGNLDAQNGHSAREHLNAPNFLNLLQSRMPGNLFRSIQNDYIVGYYQNSSGNEPVLILKSDSYANAFPGMLQWEPNISNDLGSLFNLPTDSATSSARTFVDRIIDNRDARVLLEDGGNPTFIYSFIDPATIIFVKSQNAFDEILSRYLANRGNN